MANEQYIGQLKETFATSVPNRIAAFFGEPIQVQYSVVAKNLVKKAFVCWSFAFHVNINWTDQMSSPYNNRRMCWQLIWDCGNVFYVQGVGGAVQYPKNYLKEAYRLVRERSGVCIADEVRFTFCVFLKKKNFCHLSIYFLLTFRKWQNNEES